MAGAETYAGTSSASAREPGKLSLEIVPSSNSSGPGDIIDIAYLIRNKSNTTLLNISLATLESGPLALNVSRLLPGQAAGAIESLKIEEGHLPGPLLRTAEASALDPLGAVLRANSTASITIGAESQ